MLLKVFKAKIHRATVTAADLNYEGSITIDKDLLHASGMRKYEAVWIWNVTNGQRLMTYILEGEPGSGVICLNGAAARHCQPGDKVIITAFVDVTPEELDTFEPTVVMVDDKNKVKEVRRGSGHSPSEGQPDVRSGQQLPEGGFLKFGHK
jgi:aspartate 1-decarboxylase